MSPDDDSRNTDTSADEFRAFDRMTIPELAAAWCAQQYVGLREATDETRRAGTYFEHLPHDQPERALALVLAVLASDVDKSVKMHLNHTMMTTLLHKHSSVVFPDLEKAARELPAMRWLLGGAAWWAGDGVIKPRLMALADEDAWNADDDAHDTPKEVIDFTVLSINELARVWIEQRSKPYKDQDDNWSALMDCERQLHEHDPDRIIDMILEILRVEDNQNVLGLLAAGPLEDVIGYATIDRIEREAARNEKFVWLLGGVWYDSEPEDLQKRLDAIVQGRHW